MEEHIKLQEQIRIFKTTLEDLKNQVAARRTELTNLVHTTEDHLSANVVQLKADVEYLHGEIARLQGEQKLEQARLDSKQDNLEKEYKSFSYALKASYAKKEEALQEKQRQADIAIGEAKNEKLVAEAKQTRLDLVIKENLNKKTDLDNQQKELDKKKDEFRDYVHSTTQALRTDEDNIKEKNAVADKRIADANDLLKNAESKQSQVQAILNRIAEADEKLDIVRGIEEENKLKEEELNRLRVKTLAEQNENSVERRRLKELRKELEDRELNIEKAEKRVVA